MVVYPFSQNWYLLIQCFLGLYRNWTEFASGNTGSNWNNIIELAFLLTERSNKTGDEDTS